MASAKRKATNKDLADRVRQLEGALLRIAAELESCGLMSPAVPRRDLPELRTLTPREQEVLSHLRRGARVPTIAHRLDISASTVRNHLRSIFQKLGVNSQAELMEKLQ